MATRDTNSVSDNRSTIELSNLPRSVCELKPRPKVIRVWR